MDAFDNSVCLSVASGDQLLVDTVFVLEEIGELQGEFASSIHDDFCWPWILGQPGYLQIVGYEIGSLGRDRCNVEPACHWIDHVKTPKGYFRVLLVFTNLVWTDQVDTERMPWNCFRTFGR